MGDVNEYKLQDERELEHIVIPDFVSNISVNFFSNHTSVKSIYFGKDFSKITEYTWETDFYRLLCQCKCLEKIEFSEENEHWKVVNNAILSKDGKTLAFAVPTIEGDYIIPDGVEVIKMGAFRNNKKITSVKFPSTIKRIECDAFYCCTGINEIIIPDTIEFIGNLAFYKMELYWDKRGYKKVSIGIRPGQKADKYAIEFPQDTVLVYPELPLGLVADKTEKMRLMMGFFLHPELYHGEYLKDYKRYAKKASKSIIRFAMENHIDAVEKYYKELDCKANKQNYAKQREEIGRALKNKTVAEWKKEWKYRTCEFLNPFTKQWEESIVLTQYKGNDTEVFVPSKIGRRPVRAIDYPGFEGNEKITSVQIPETVGVIGEFVFSLCKNLKKVEFLGKDVELCRGCFATCPVLEEVKLDVASTKFDGHIFQGCWRMLDKEGFVIFGEGENKSLVDVQLPVFSEEVIIPDGIVRLLGKGLSERYCYARKFRDVYKVKKVVLPDSVKEIGAEFFADCINLEEINIPVGVDKIGKWAFMGCDSCKNLPVYVETVEPETLKEYYVWGWEKEEIVELEIDFGISPEECAWVVLTGGGDTMYGLEHNQKNNPAILSHICDTLEEEECIEEEKALYAVQFLEKIAWNHGFDEALAKRLFVILQKAGVSMALEGFEKNKILREIVKK